MAREQYEQALATLVRARRNAGRHPYVLDLLCKAYRGLGDWQALSDLLPELRKYKVMPEDELAGLESEVQVRLLQASAAAGGRSMQQLDLFRPPSVEIVDRLRRVELDRMTPLEAMNLLAELTERSQGN